jgi:lipoprotein-anchoring transpeptidase ErfK/SrfK
VRSDCFTSLCLRVTLIALQSLALHQGMTPAFGQNISYHVEQKQVEQKRNGDRSKPVSAPPVAAKISDRFTPEQVSLLEKLNRADQPHLAKLPALVIPDPWIPAAGGAGLNELMYSPLPQTLSPTILATAPSKLIVIHLPQQVFGAYENGALVRWGPVNSGDRHAPTPEGLFHLNWKSELHVSTVSSEWNMAWTFNFENKRGRALHAYEMPGLPASHGCVRLLDRDARWVFDWGDPWQLSPNGQIIIRAGTPVWIIGQYDFANSPPWRNPDQVHGDILLPNRLPE